MERFEKILKKFQEKSIIFSLKYSSLPRRLSNSWRIEIGVFIGMYSISFLSEFIVSSIVASDFG